MSEALAYETESGQTRSERGTFQAVYDPAEIVSELCERLREGEPLAQVCRDSHMPNYTMIYAWMQRDPQAAQDIADARFAGEHAIAARLRRVAQGEQGYSSGDVQRDKLIIETDLKLLAKWNPKAWGDNLQLRHADSEGAKLDTSALVSELLALTNGQPVIESTARNVTPAPQAPAAAKPAFRPRARPAADDVSDLV